MDPFVSLCDRISQFVHNFYATSYCPIDAKSIRRIMFTNDLLSSGAVNGNGKTIVVSFVIACYGDFNGDDCQKIHYIRLFMNLLDFFACMVFLSFLGVIIMYICWLIRSCIQLTPIDWLVV